MEKEFQIISEKRDQTVSISTLRPYTNQLKEIVTLLDENLSREELMTILQDLRDIGQVVDRFLSLKSSQVVDKVPEEIWKSIFSWSSCFVGKKDFLITQNDMDNYENQLRIYAYVSKLWSKVVDEFAPDYFQIQNFFVQIGFC